MPEHPAPDGSAPHERRTTGLLADPAGLRRPGVTPFTAGGADAPAGRNTGTRSPVAVATAGKAGLRQTPEERETSLALAFLVDGDNASVRQIPEILAEASRYGEVVIRRVYGDWASGRFASWKTVVQDHALVPVQQFANVAGKNATDSALIIDAMDILHTGRISGFCIVSSDSDYTRLATRLREEGMFVLGVGRAQTPAAFRNACIVFVSVVNLAPASREADAARPSGSPAAAGAPPKGGRARGTKSPAQPPSEALGILNRAFDAAVDDDGFCHLASLGNALRRLDPGFDPRTYGRSRLVDLVADLPKAFELRRPAAGSAGPILLRRHPAETR